ncbi:MAG: DsbA family protein [Gemmatimonadetes bacterium]|uniref:DsbA family protein n=1 Tax=Candidatus Kutchimonas denitrificans TaxID=3056748 RepID=A0AAE4ZBT8_9BACT|nr:DsbA family protein [Gemmatimonadota bacterium]NIR76477.1 DsbA family protein [Candidatus Kutchimonas denitrificans]NIS03295.1 DsbA family protein [Gemmatimonadota bacterium]NIT69156.1 DsbA family protein [Gemmatimonadota bacterium]NIU54548.1 thioredoxin domain-containing protein [Gemmatimonadota bacterium]
MAKSQSRFYGVLAVILIVGGGLIGYVVINNRDSGAVPADYEAPGLAEGEMVSADVGVSIGAEDAPVVLEEYADYQCPACGMVGTLTLPQIIDEYVETGKVRFVFYDFPLHPGASELGAMAARCAGDQDAYWAMQKVLMGRMREWGSARNPERLIRDYAEGLGLDGDALIDCVESDKYRRVVLASRERARQLGLGQTPTFFINGRVFTGAVGYDQMAQMIEAELAKQ